jgi:serine/threonine-protein phosphatase CPPED1
MPEDFSTDVCQLEGRHLKIKEIAMKSKLVFVLAIFIFLIPGFGQEQPFHFLILTDPQMGMYANNGNFVRETANYEFAVKTANRLKPGFVIVLGDLVNKEGDPDQIREFLRITRNIDSSIPVYLLPGNHDVEAVPTKESLAAYRRNIGKDYYSFRAGPVYGIVLNSSLIHSPQMAGDEYQKQNTWFKEELETARKSGAQIIVFQHHAYFVSAVQEPDQHANIPLERRKPMIELLHANNVNYVFAGHSHTCTIGKDGNLEMVVTGPVSMPFGETGSGMRLVEVTPAGVQHRYYDFGRLPDKLSIK